MIPAEVLVRIPGCEDGAPPLMVAPLPGGRGVNQVLRVDTRQGRFVWRCRLPPIDRPAAAAATELRAHAAVAAAGLAPALLAAEPGGRWLLMEYIDAEPWTAAQLAEPGRLDRLAVQIARLHALPVPSGIAPFDAVATASGQLARLAARNPSAAAALAPLRDQVALITERLGAQAMRRCLNHGDLVAGNMLGHQSLLVDWEYAQVTDPLHDIAGLAVCYPELAPLMPRLLDQAGLPGPVEQGRFGLHLERFSLLHRLWEAAEAA